MALGFDVGAAEGVEEAGEGWVFGDGEGEVFEELGGLG